MKVPASVSILGHVCLVCTVKPVWPFILPMAMGANKVQRKSRRVVHMMSEFDLEVDVEALPAEPRHSGEELFLSQLSVTDTIQACRGGTQRARSLYFNLHCKNNNLAIVFAEINIHLEKETHILGNAFVLK